MANVFTTETRRPQSNAEKRENEQHTYMATTSPAPSVSSVPLW